MLKKEQQDLDGEAIKNLDIADNLNFEITQGNKGKIYEKAQRKLNWLDNAQYEKTKTRLTVGTQNVQ